MRRSEAHEDLPMSGGRCWLGFSIEGFSEIKLRVNFVWIYVQRFFPGVDGLIGIAEASCEQSIVHESVRVAREYLQHFLVMLVGIGVAAGFNQCASVGMLKRDVLRAKGDGLLERGDGFVTRACL